MVTASAAEDLEIRHLGLVPYGEALALQEHLRARLGRGEIAETILLLEHPDVITYGRSAKDANAHAADVALNRLGYEVFRVNRGGDVTWHGPGQLVGYPLLDLQRHGADVHRYLRALEGALIDALSEFGIDACRREGYAGVWLDERSKIASIGVGLRRWLTLHGFALNVNCDLERFDAIVPCGLADVRMVSMASVLGRELDFAEVRRRVEGALRKAFS